MKEYGNTGGKPHDKVGPWPWNRAKNIRRDLYQRTWEKKAFLLFFLVNNFLHWIAESKSKMRFAIHTLSFRRRVASLGEIFSGVTTPLLTCSLCGDFRKVSYMLNANGCNKKKNPRVFILNESSFQSCRQ